jgi:serine/threonine protein kinase
MEYIPGGSLRTLIDEYGSLNEKLIKIYVKQILTGLNYLHNKGIVHRDLKSENILIDLNGSIKLTDFNCAGRINPSGDSNILNSLKGTIPFMAPEVILQNNYGRKADIWSLGCIILEMYTSEAPWGNIANMLDAICKIGKSGEIPKIPADASNDLKDFLLNCFKRNPKERANVDILLNHKFLS